MNIDRPQLATLNEIRRYIYEFNGKFEEINKELRRILAIASKYTFGDVAAGNYSEFTRATGFLSMNGDARAWDDANMASVSYGAGASAPDLVDVNGTGVLLRGFDGNATTEQLFLCIEIPHSYQQGSNLVFHVHWAPVDNVGGNVLWQLTYWAVSGAAPVATTINVVGAAGTTAWQERRTDFVEINGTNFHIGEQFGFRLFRDPTNVLDTYANDAIVFTAGFHFVKDTIGSRTITTK